MTADQLEDYRRHPDLFFGQESGNGGNIEDPYRMFEWMHKTYSKTTKERLLEFMAGASEIDKLRQLPQEELALIYCERMVFNFLAAHAPEKLDQPGDAFRPRRSPKRPRDDLDPSTLR